MAGFTITSTSSGVVLSNPATQNPATVVAGAYITNTTASYYGDAVYGSPAAAWNFTNLGRINAAGTAAAGVMLSGIVTNGAAGASSALISGSYEGVVVAGATGTVSNFGTILGTGTNSRGILLGAYGGASITNASGALISGVEFGVALIAGSDTVANSGTIRATGTGGAGILQASARRVSLVVMAPPSPHAPRFLPG